MLLFNPNTWVLSFLLNYFECLPFWALASLQATAGVKKRLAVHVLPSKVLEPCSYHFQTTRNNLQFNRTFIFLSRFLLFRLEHLRNESCLFRQPGNLALLGLICQGPPQGPRHLGSMRRIPWPLLASFALPRFHSTSCSLLGPESAIV